MSRFLVAHVRKNKAETNPLKQSYYAIDKKSSKKN